MKDQIKDMHKFMMQRIEEADILSMQVTSKGLPKLYLNWYIPTVIGINNDMDAKTVDYYLKIALKDHLEKVKHKIKDEFKIYIVPRESLTKYRSHFLQTKATNLSDYTIGCEIVNIMQEELRKRDLITSQQFLTERGKLRRGELSESLNFIRNRINTYETLATKLGQYMADGVCTKLDYSKSNGKSVNRIVMYAIVEWIDDFKILLHELLTFTPGINLDFKKYHLSSLFDICNYIDNELYQIIRIYNKIIDKYCELKNYIDVNVDLNQIDIYEGRGEEPEIFRKCFMDAKKIISVNVNAESSNGEFVYDRKRI